jgi:hypothetical protein
LTKTIARVGFQVSAIAKFIVLAVLYDFISTSYPCALTSYLIDDSTLQNTMKVMESSLFDKTFRDIEGNVVIIQPPNLPLLIWLAATLLKLVPIRSDSISIILDTIAFGALFTWAWLELFEGVNYFRRTLGFVVLIGAIAWKVHDG